jgi:hypothetical protein
VEPVTLGIGNDLDAIVADGGHDGVGRAEVDTDDGFHALLE